jgi:hypothetical protein
VCGAPAPGQSAEEEANPFGMELEAILSIKVTSVSKKPEEAGAAAAALSVLTGEDIRRSGAHSLPEALRTRAVSSSRISGRTTRSTCARDSTWDRA